MERRDGFCLWCLLVLTSGFYIGTSNAQVYADCPVYSDEGQDLRCFCKYKTSSAPAHSPQFSWLNESTDAELFKPAVNRSLNGTVFTCQMVLGGQTSTVTYTLLVVYGPRTSDVSIIPDSPLPADKGPVTLTCLATEVNPPPTFAWTGLTCAGGNHSNTCTFTPALPGDENRNVTCTVTNAHLSSSPNSASRTVTLKFATSTMTTTTTTTTTTPTTTTTEKATPPKPTTTTGTGSQTTTSQASNSSISPTSSPSTTPRRSVPPTPPTTQPPTTTTSPKTTDDVTTTGGDRMGDDTFPMAAFAGGLAGAFALILLIIVIVVLCRRKKERDISLMRSGDHYNESYKNSDTPDFYTYDNAGYDQRDYGMTETIPSEPPLPKTHHQHTHSSSSSHAVDMERALGFYDSVPSTTSSNNNNNNNDNKVEDTLEHSEGTRTAVDESCELGDQEACRQDGHGGSIKAGGGVVRFENPSYQVDSTPETTQPEDTDSNDKLTSGGAANPDPYPEPDTSSTPAAAAGPEDYIYAEVNKTSTSSSPTPTPPATTPTTTPSTSAGTTVSITHNDDHDDDDNDKGGDNFVADPTTTLPGGEGNSCSPDHVVGPLGDVYAQPQSSQQVQVTSDPSSTVITLTNNHNNGDDEDFLSD